MRGTRRWPRRLAWITLAFLLVLGLGPFLLPLPSLDTVPPAELASPEDRFMDLDGITVRYREWGGGSPTFLLLHGFGSHADSWSPVAADLAELGRVVAFDRAGFGLTERPVRWEGTHPYGDVAQMELILELMDHMGIEDPVLVGHSAGGGLAVGFALAYPERVGGLVLEAPSLGAGAGGWLRPILATPQGRRVVRFVARRAGDRIPSILASAYHDPDRLTVQMTDAYRLPLRADDWDLGFAHFVAAPRSTVDHDLLQDLELPVLVITGDDDTWVDPDETIALAAMIPDSTLQIVPDCGHVVHEECPSVFIRALEGWVAE
jgi:pimeloyl-ACP methyl ester carboxylesterase